MSKKTKIILIVLVSLVIFGLISVEKEQSEVESRKVEAPVVKETKTTAKLILEPAPSQNAENITVTVIAGEEKIKLSVPTDTSFYDALMEAKNSGKILFSGKNYTGMGFFVTEIGTLHSGNGKDLLYYINGKEATVGVSSYVLQDGDILEWKLE